jgi:ABC-type lipoprotein release transport system permease subunit
MLWGLAWRNVWRNRRRTLLTLLAMVLSAALLIVTLATYEGMMVDLLVNTTRQYTGDASVSTADYRKDQDFFAVIDDPETVLRAVSTDPSVRGASPRLHVYGLVSSGESTVSVEMLGVDWSREAKVTDIHLRVFSGRVPADPASSEVLVGEGLAGKLGVRIGDEVVFLTQAADGSVGNDLYRVEGIFKTGDPARDSFLVMAGIGRLGEMTALAGKAHEIALATGDPAGAPLAAARVDRAVRSLEPSLRGVPWQTLLPVLAQVMGIFDASMIVTTVILYFAAGMVVVNTMLMAFHERRREFGVLMAVGMTPWQVRRLLLAEALLLGLTASAVGGAVGVAASLALHGGIDLSRFMSAMSFGGGSFLPIIRAELTARVIAYPVVGLLAMSLAAVAMPAMSGGRRAPAADIQEAAG